MMGDEDIPYEVRMKYIIDAYRKDQKKWGKLLEYAKHLEGEVINSRARYGCHMQTHASP